jgi:hypothetical protein
MIIGKQGNEILRVQCAPKTLRSKAYFARLRVALAIHYTMVPVGISRAVLLLEAVLIVLPGTVYAVWGMVLLELLAGPSGSHQLYVLLIGVLGLVPLIAGWRLIGAFARNGPSGLRAVRGVWWALTLPGALFAVGAIASWWVPFGSSWWNATALPRWSIVTAPALIPLCHLALERWARSEVH